MYSSYSAVLVLPWMAWNGNGRWSVSALLWLAGILLPIIWFGIDDSVQLYREWFASILAAVGNDDANQLSVGADVAALRNLKLSDPVVRMTAFALQIGWLGALRSRIVHPPRQQCFWLRTVAKIRDAACSHVGCKKLARILASCCEGRRGSSIHRFNVSNHASLSVGSRHGERPSTVSGTAPPVDAITALPYENASMIGSPNPS